MSGVENDALPLQDGYVWYEVREVMPSALRPLDEVKDQVTQGLRGSAVAHTRHRKRPRPSWQRLAPRRSLTPLPTETGAEIKTITAVKRNDVSEEFDGLAAMALFAAPPIA